MAVFLFIPARGKNLRGTFIDGQRELQEEWRSWLLWSSQASRLVDRDCLQNLESTDNQSSWLYKLDLGLGLCLLSYESSFGTNSTAVDSPAGKWFGKHAMGA